MANHGEGMSSLFEIAFDPPPRGSRRSAESVYAQLRAAILDGRLVPESKLPGERQSAVFFGVSRNTIARVYTRLAVEGLVQPRQGSGTYVAQKRSRPPRERFLPQQTPDTRLNSLWSRPEFARTLNSGTTISAAGRPARLPLWIFGPRWSIHDYFRSKYFGESVPSSFGAWS